MSTTMREPTLSPVDLLGLDAELLDEERLVRDTTRQFVRKELLPNVADWFEEGTLPRELAPKIGALGLLGMHLEGYGCAGASPVAYGLVCAELEAGDTGLRSLVSVQGSLAMFPIWKFGSEEQKQEWLPRMAAGEAIGCFGLTEPDAGSDPASMRTFARREPSGDWVLNGTKMWITNGSIADVAIVWAKTEEGIRGFVVPTDTPGFATQDIHHKLSLRASITSELLLEDVRLPASAQLPGARGLGAPLTVLGEARLGIVFGVTGAARACLESAVEYARTRVQFDRPIGAFQLTQGKLAEMSARVAAGQLLALRLGRMKEAGVLKPEHVSLGKYSNVSSALEVARMARTILGANGITLEYPVMRHAANLETVLTYEGTHEVHALVLGRALTGLNAFG
jgi:glutaryl-CoA dehydrogenase